MSSGIGTRTNGQEQIYLPAGEERVARRIVEKEGIMSNWLTTPLGRAEVIGYLIYVAGFGVLVTRGVLHDPWVEAGLLAMIVGLGVAGRGEAARAARAARSAS